MREVTFNEIAEIFGEIIDLSGIQIDSSTVLGEDIPVDSREMLRILSRIESQYRFRFNPKEVLGLKTMEDILQVIQRRASEPY
ncbi:MAG: phosphopantetheine-binding protein [Desulfatiglandales bacterium]